MLSDAITAIALAVSTFNGLACLWLSVSVALLNWRPAASGPSDTQQARLIPLLAVSLMGLSALFFMAHSALIGRDIFSSGVGPEFWWRVMWVPVLLVPYLWYSLSVLYSGPRALRRHRLALTLLGIATGLNLMLAQGGGLPSYDQTLRYESSQALQLGVPLVAWSDLPVLLLCALLPIDALLYGLHDPGQRSEARRRARPALIASSLLLLLAGILAALAILWVADDRRVRPLPSIDAIMLVDVLVAAIIGLCILIVGNAIVSYEVFTGGALPRRGFLQRWVGTVVVLLTSALLTAVLVSIDLRPIYGLLAASAVATVAYALLGWQNDRIRAAFMIRLRPFLAAVAPLQSPLRVSGDTWQPLFIALCQDVLTTPRACLVHRTATGTEVALRYGWDDDRFDPQAMLLDLSSWNSNARVPKYSGRSAYRLATQAPTSIPKLIDGRRYGVAWALPLGSGSLEGALLFDGRTDAAIYNEEEIDLAQACCERLLDALAGEQLTAVAVQLLRQRIAEVKVLGTRQRRVLHDEVLPDIHAALIHLGSARADQSGTLLPPETASAITKALSAAHRRLADLIRAIPPASPHHLERDGLAAAIQAMLQHDFAQSFEHACWYSEPQAEEYARTLAPFAAEVVFYAVQEVVRNAARHGRGNEVERPLHLEVAMTWNDGLHISINADGVGLDTRSATPGSGSGLLFHEAMLAVIGGHFTVTSKVEEGSGTLAHISLGADNPL